MGLKARFHETTKIEKINHRCIQIDRWVKETCGHRPMDIGTILADDKTFFSNFVGRRSGILGKIYSTM